MPPARRVLSAAVLLPFLLVATPPDLHATTTIHVSTTADDASANGNCTLREAVIAANTDTAVDRCPAGSGSDIVLLRGGTFTLTLTGPNEDAGHSGDLDIVGGLTIRGAGAGVTILDGGAFEDYPDRVLHVLVGAAVIVSGVTIRGGLCGGGGGILNRGTLTISDSVLRDNIVNEVVSCGPIGGGGAAIYNSGALEIVRSTLSDNAVHGAIGPDDVSYPGGGLLNRGTAVIRNTVISDNFAGAGGGISNTGSLEVIDAEISANFARFWAAGLDNEAGSAVLTRTTVAENADGGILNGGYNGTSAFLTLQDSTVSGNRAYRVPGAIFNFGGSINATGSTIANNESYASTPCPDGPPCPLPVAGIAAAAYLTNTILSNPGYRNCGTPAISFGNNLDSDGSCGLNAGGDLPSVNAQLRPLADNGGPTRTHALRNASPAIDHVPAGQCAATDQRGVARPQPPGGGCDVGAYEFAPDADLRFLIGDVQDLHDLLTTAQLLELLQPLKIALADLTAGRTEHACEMLDVFIATVSKYAGGGVLSVDTAKALIATAGRIKTMICR